MRQQLTTSAVLLCFCLLFTSLASAADPELQARRLLNALGCKACHRFGGDGGSLAPALDKIGSRRTKAQIEQYLSADAETRKDGFMPSYGTTPAEELKLLSDFLYRH